MWWPAQVEESEQNLGHTRLSGVAEKHNVFRPHAAPHGVCDNLINAPKPLANLHQDGSPVNVLVEGLQARSRLKNDGSAAKVHHDGQPRGGKDRRLGEDPGIALGDGGQMYSGLPLSQWCVKERIN